MYPIHTVPVKGRNFGTMAGVCDAISARRDELAASSLESLAMLDVLHRAGQALGGQSGAPALESIHSLHALVSPYTFTPSSDVDSSLEGLISDIRYKMHRLGRASFNSSDDLSVNYLLHIDGKTIEALRDMTAHVKRVSHGKATAGTPKIMEDFRVGGKFNMQDAEKSFLKAVSSDFANLKLLSADIPNAYGAWIHHIHEVMAKALSAKDGFTDKVFYDCMFTRVPIDMVVTRHQELTKYESWAGHKRLLPEKEVWVDRDTQKPIDDDNLIAYASFVKGLRLNIYVDKASVTKDAVPHEFTVTRESVLTALNEGLTALETLVTSMRKYPLIAGAFFKTSQWRQLSMMDRPAGMSETSRVNWELCRTAMIHNTIALERSVVEVAYWLFRMLRNVEHVTDDFVLG